MQLFVYYPPCKNWSCNCHIARNLIKSLLLFYESKVIKVNFIIINGHNSHNTKLKKAVEQCRLLVTVKYMYENTREGNKRQNYARYLRLKFRNSKRLFPFLNRK